MTDSFKLRAGRPSPKAAWLIAGVAVLLAAAAAAQSPPPAQQGMGAQSLGGQNVGSRDMGSQDMGSQDMGARNGWPQPGAPSAPQAAPAAPAAPWPDGAAAPQAPRHEPGAMEAFGRWFDDSAANMRKGFDEMWKGMGSASKGTADALGKLGGSRVVGGRERCLPAPNGAPDCQAAAIRICRAAGFNTGASADFVISEECPASAYANGRKPRPGECPVESVVIKAMCSQ